MQPLMNPHVQHGARGIVQPGALEIVSLNQVKRSAAKWLLPGWLPQGACCVLEGRKGAGKSHLAAAFAAWITGGAAPPGAKRLRAGKVLWGAGEESIERETKPKLQSAGVKLQRVLTFGGKDRSRLTRLPKFPADFPWLADIIGEYKIKLLVLDPIRSFVESWVNLKDEQHAGLVMEGLAQIANLHGCCVMGLRNLKKGRSADTLDEGIGSVALSNISRVVLRALPPETEDDWRTLRVLATNYDKPRADHQYKIVGAGAGSRIEWGKALEQRDDDNQGADLDAGQALEANVAEELIRRELDNGPARSTQLSAIALREQISKSTLWRTLKKLGAVHKRHGAGADAYSEWSFPKQKGGVQKTKGETSEKRKREKRERP